jgi:ribose transport system permease protein
MIARTRIEPFIMTLGAMAIYRSLVVYMADAGEFSSHSALFREIGMAGDPFLAVPYPAWIFLLLTLFCALLLNWTKFGRHVRASGANEKAAAYAAVKVDRVRAFSYILTGAMTGISAFWLAARLGSVSSASVGVGVELDAIASVMIGGASMIGGGGAISGTVIGAVILGIVNNMFDMLEVSPHLQGAVKGVVIIAAVMVQRKKR